jgi:hypothetical protein
MEGRASVKRAMLSVEGEATFLDVLPSMMAMCGIRFASLAYCCVHVL